VLLLQALLLGAGGVTSMPVNALAMGLVGAAAARAAYHLLRPLHEASALVTAGWLSVNASAFVVAVALGLQPLIAHSADGRPLFFPFGPSITLPAVMVPHAAIGLGEGVLTLLVVRFVRRRGWFPSA
jgi:cobalt/nickel transport system permease protein